MSKIEAGVSSGPSKEQPKAASAQEVADFASFRFEQASEKAGKIGSEAEREKNEKESIELGETRLILAEAIANAGDDATKIRDFLSEKITELEKGLRESSGDERADYELHEKYEEYLRAQKFLYENKMRKFDEDKDFQRWKKYQRPTSSEKSQQPESQEGAPRSGRIFEIRETLSGHEREKLLNDVVERSAKRVDLPMPKSLSRGEKTHNQYLTHSFYSNELIQDSEQPIVKKLALLVDAHPHEREDIRSVLKSHQVNELLYIEDVVERPIHEDPKGALALLKASFKGPKITGYEPRRYSEFFYDSELRHNNPYLAEPAVRFTYFVSQEPRPEISEEVDNFTALRLTLPRSLGTKLMGMIDRDPRVIREIFKRSLRERQFSRSRVKQRSIDFSDGSYEPPYAEWDRQPSGSKMYLQYGEAEQKWHPEFVRSLS